MADYYPLVARAVAGLEKNTGEARRALYERARAALVAQLRASEPPLAEADITRERLALEEAIRRIETETVRQARGMPAFQPSMTRGPAPTPPSRPASERGLPERQVPESRIPSQPLPASPVQPLPASPVRPLPASPVRPSFPQSAPPSSPVGDEAEAARSFEPAPQSRPASGKPPFPPTDTPSAFPSDPVPDWTLPGKPADKIAPEDNASEQSEFPPAPWPDESQNRRQNDWQDTHSDTHRDARRNTHRDAREDESAGLSRQMPGQEAPAFPSYRPHEPEDDAPSPSLRNYGGLIRLAVILVLCAALAGLVYWQRGNIAGLFEAMRAPSEQQAQPDTPPQQGRPKIADRIETPAQKDQAAAKASAQRVVLYEEDPNDPQGKRFVGSAIWRVENVAAGPGQAAEIAVRADVEIPERRMTMSLVLRRNTDKTLPASHTIELMFNLPADFPGGGISNVPGVMMKQAEQTRGTPLVGLAVKVTSGFFLIGLSAVETDMQRNIQLLKERAWFDIPIVYANNRRAILAIERGPPGERAFTDAFAFWKQ